MNATEKPGQIFSGINQHCAVCLAPDSAANDSENHIVPTCESVVNRGFLRNEQMNDEKVEKNRRQYRIVFQSVGCSWGKNNLKGKLPDKDKES